MKEGSGKGNLENVIKFLNVNWIFYLGEIVTTNPVYESSTPVMYSTLIKRLSLSPETILLGKTENPIQNSTCPWTGIISQAQLSPHSHHKSDQSENSIMQLKQICVSKPHWHVYPGEPTSNNFPQRFCIFPAASQSIRCCGISQWKFHSKSLLHLRTNKRFSPDR